MDTSTNPWGGIEVSVETCDTLPVPIYPVLAKLWIDEATRRGVVAVKIGRWPAGRIVDYRSYMGEFIALLQIGEKLVILSLSNFNAVQCNVGSRTLRVRTLEAGEDLQEIFGYSGVH